MSQDERRQRAGHYVMGMLDERERERAERDLEVDAAFREAVVEAAERLNVFPSRPAGGATDEAWREVAARIKALPHMREVPAPALPAAAPGGQSFGRRRTDVAPKTPARPAGVGLHHVPGKRGVLLAAVMLAVFALGYAAGVFTTMP